MDASHPYRARDLVGVPGLLSLLRIPLGILFILEVDRPWIALALLAAAGISDLLDGWYARRFGLRSATGAALDPIADKLFAGMVAAALLLRGRFSLVQTLLLNTRELGEIPLVVWMLFSRRARIRRMENATSNVLGKLATVLQFGAIGSALLRWSQTWSWVIATALMGAFAAAAYWRRELRPMARADSSEPEGGAGA